MHLHIFESDIEFSNSNKLAQRSNYVRRGKCHHPVATVLTKFPDQEKDTKQEGQNVNRECNYLRDCVIKELNIAITVLMEFESV